jgi:arylsulfatase
MTTLAAMIDRLDQEVGRLVASLKVHGELENTFILFVSDNGACPYDRSKPQLNVEPTNADTSLADSTGWAWARNSPFRYYKQNQFEGGISTPAVMHWPAGLKAPQGSVVNEPAHLIDVLPTIAEITGSKIPLHWTDRELRPVSGISLKPIVDGSQLGARSPIHFLFSSDRGLRDGDWKLVSFQSAAWELYNVAKDRTELNNLAASEPERLKAMIRIWTDMTNNVLHAPAKASSPVTESALPHRHREWTDFQASATADEGGKSKSRRKAKSR